MIRNTLIAALLLALCAAFGFAADVSGRWEGTAEWPEGPMALMYTLKADGATLTGTVQAVGYEFPISDGQVNGEEFSFKVVVEGDGSQYLHHGKFTGDTMQMAIEGPVSKVELTLKRASQPDSPAQPPK
jgi:diphthamide synthase subunit DPH2